MSEPPPRCPTCNHLMWSPVCIICRWKPNERKKRRKSIDRNINALHHSPGYVEAKQATEKWAKLYSLHDRRTH